MTSRQDLIEELIPVMRDARRTRRKASGIDYRAIADAFFDELTRAYVDSDDASEAYLPAARIRRQLGQFTGEKGPGYYWYDVIIGFLQARKIISIRVQGHHFKDTGKGKITLIEVHDNEFANAPVRNFERHIEEAIDPATFDPNKHYEGWDFFPVNQERLHEYVAFVTEHGRTSQANQRRQAAQHFLLMAAAYKGYVPHERAESSYGRLYYRGKFNLQNCPRQVRTQALMGWYETDIESAVFSFKLNLAVQLNKADPKLGMALGDLPMTWEAIQNKQAFRTQIAKAIKPYATSDEEWEDAVQRAKQVLTAIGFGAIKTGSWLVSRGPDMQAKWKHTAIRDACGSREAMVRVSALPRFKQFRDEQKRLNAALDQLILEHYVTEDDLNTMPELESKPSNRIAFAYQKEERSIIERFCELYLARNPDDPVLIVHDAMFTPRKPDKLELLTELEQIWPEFARIKVESIGISSRQQEIREEEERHAFFRRQENKKDPGNVQSEATLEFNPDDDIVRQLASHTRRELKQYAASMGPNERLRFVHEVQQVRPAEKFQADIIDDAAFEAFVIRLSNIHRPFGGRSAGLKVNFVPATDK